MQASKIIYNRTINNRTKIAILKQTFYNWLMKFYRVKLSLGLAFIVLFFSACGGVEKTNVNIAAPSENSNSTSNTVAKDDIEELGKIIKLPFAPEEATYNESNVNGRKLVAVLRFSEEQANQISAQAEKYKTPAPSDIDAETWFPPELIAKSQETGDSALKGVEYAPNDFLQAPFSKGKLTRINNTNYFVLELVA